MFVGYCVGHRNHRYFCLFLFYMWASVFYCTYFNTVFLQVRNGLWKTFEKGHIIMIPPFFLTRAK